MEILGKLLGSPARVKIMRLFLQNKDVIFETKDIVLRSRVSPSAVRSELKVLQLAGMVKKGSKGYFFDTGFKYTREFEILLIGTETFSDTSIAEHFKKTGKLKLLISSGYFIKSPDSRVDLLLVGDTLHKGKIEEAVRRLEAEIGTEPTYSVFETQEFLYRLNMYDKLVRDILDFPHKVIFQSKELGPQVLQKA